MWLLSDASFCLLNNWERLHTFSRFWRREIYPTNKYHLYEKASISLEGFKLKIQINQQRNIRDQYGASDVETIYGWT